MIKKRDNQPALALELLVESAGEPVSEDIALRLKEFRSRFGLGQRELALKLGVTGSFVSEIENGRSKPGFDFSFKLARMFNISLDWLILGRGDMVYSQPVLPEANAADQDIQDFFYYFSHSPLFKFDILSFANKYLDENLEKVKKNIVRNKERSQ